MAGPRSAGGSPMAAAAVPPATAILANRQSAPLVRGAKPRARGSRGPGGPPARAPAGYSARSAVAVLVPAAQLAGSSAPATAIISPARASTTTCQPPYTLRKLAGRPVLAAAAITGSTWWCSVIPTGTAIRPATRPTPATQQTTMVMACRGVIPIALNTPRSCTRSLVCSTTVLSTPSPAAIASSSVSVPIRPMMTAKSLPRPVRFTSYGARRCSARTYDVAETPGRSPTSYWSGVAPGSARVSVSQPVIMTTPLLSVSKTCPTIFTGTSLPPETIVTVSPTDLPVSLRKPVPTTAGPGVPVPADHPVAGPRRIAPEGGQGNLLGQPRHADRLVGLGDVAQGARLRPQRRGEGPVQLGRCKQLPLAGRPGPNGTSRYLARAPLDNADAAGAARRHEHLHRLGAGVAEA